MSGLSNFSSPPPTATIEPCGRFFRGNFILGRTDYAGDVPASTAARDLENASVLALILLPDDDAAETLAFGTDGADFGEVPQRARGQEPRPDARVDVANLQRLVERRSPDLLLRVVAEAHRELVVEVEQIRGLREADRDGVRQGARGELVVDATRAQVAGGLPGFVHRLAIEVRGFGHIVDEHRDDEVRLVGEVRRKRRAGGRRHAVALVLAVGRVR